MFVGSREKTVGDRSILLFFHIFRAGNLSSNYLCHSTIMETINDVLRIAGLDNLKKGELCVFAGAGISFRSGVPIVKRIKEYVIGKLCSDERERQSFLGNDMPFEVFIDILFKAYLPPVSRHVPPDDKQRGEVFRLLTESLYLLMGGSNVEKHVDFFDLFNHESYVPNPNHYFIAEMLKDGVAKFAVTTNFDLLIEQAYEEVTQQPLPVYFPESDKDIDYQFPCLFKLHGGCQAPATIQTTIDRIASNEAKRKCKQMIDYVFDSGEHSTVMVLGYSFSDVFDISPAIEDIIVSPKLVVNIKHPDRREDYGKVYIDTIGDMQRIFGRYTGHQLHCTTETVISTLWKRYLKEVEMRPFGQEAVPADIESILGHWASDLSDEFQRNYICGNLMSYLERSDEACAYYVQCLHTDKATYNLHLRTRILQHIVSEDITDARGKRAELAELLKQQNAEPDTGVLTTDIRRKIMLSDRDGAIADCERGIQQAKKSGNKRAEGFYYTLYANVLNEKNGYQEALEKASRALELLEDANEHDSIKFRCNALCYMASAYENLNQPDKREHCFNEAISLAGKLNNTSEVARVYFSFARTFEVEGENRAANLRKALDYFNKGYDYCEQREAIMPMLRNSGYTLMSFYILFLHSIDSALVSEEEIDRAYRLLKEFAESRSLEKYNAAVKKDIVGGFANACYALEKYDEALDAILSALSTINEETEDKAVVEHLLHLFLVWYTEQTRHYCAYIEHNMPSENIQASASLLREALQCFEGGQISKGAAKMREGMKGVPVHCSLRDSLPYGIYGSYTRIVQVVHAIRHGKWSTEEAR